MTAWVRNSGDACCLTTTGVICAALSVTAWFTYVAASTVEKVCKCSTQTFVNITSGECYNMDLDQRMLYCYNNSSTDNLWGFISLVFLAVILTVLGIALCVLRRGAQRSPFQTRSEPPPENLVAWRHRLLSLTGLMAVSTGIGWLSSKITPLIEKVCQCSVHIPVNITSGPCINMDLKERLDYCNDNSSEEAQRLTYFFFVATGCLAALSTAFYIQHLIRTRTTCCMATGASDGSTVGLMQDVDE